MPTANDIFKKAFQWSSKLLADFKSSLLRDIQQITLRANVVNQKEVKFPEVQKVEVLNQPIIEKFDTSSLEKSLSKIRTAVKGIKLPEPKDIEFPEIPQTDLSETNRLLQDIQLALLEFHIPAPQAVDFTEVIGAINQMSLKVHQLPDTDRHSLDSSMKTQFAEVATMIKELRQIKKVSLDDETVKTLRHIFAPQTLGTGPSVVKIKNVAGALVNVATEETLQLLLNAQGSTANAAVTSVAASLTAVTLIASDTTRTGVSFYNDTATGNLYLKTGTGASTTSFTHRLQPQSLYEDPKPTYNGTFTGIWDVADGSCRVTEKT